MSKVIVKACPDEHHPGYDLARLKNLDAALRMGIPADAVLGQLLDFMIERAEPVPRRRSKRQKQ
jgi:hypothetical protein